MTTPKINRVGRIDIPSSFPATFDITLVATAPSSGYAIDCCQYTKDGVHTIRCHVDEPPKDSVQLTAMMEIKKVVTVEIPEGVEEVVCFQTYVDKPHDDIFSIIAKAPNQA